MTTDLLGTYRTDGSDSNVTESQRSRIGRNAVSLGAIVHHVHSTNCPIKLTNLTLEASATTFPENQSEGKLSALFPCPVRDIAQTMSAAWFSFPFTSPRKGKPLRVTPLVFETVTPPTDVTSRRKWTRVSLPGTVLIQLYIPNIFVFVVLLRFSDKHGK